MALFKRAQVIGGPPIESYPPSPIQPAEAMTEERAIKAIDVYYKELTGKSYHEETNLPVRRALTKQAKKVAMKAIGKQIKVVEFLYKQEMLKNPNDGIMLIHSFQDIIDYLETYEEE